MCSWACTIITETIVTIECFSSCSPQQLLRKTPDKRFQLSNCFCYWKQVVSSYTRQREELKFHSHLQLYCVALLIWKLPELNVKLDICKLNYAPSIKGHFLIQHEHIKTQVNGFSGILWPRIVSNLLPSRSKFDLFFIDALKMGTCFCYWFSYILPTR